jgi:hypothetical protein
VHVLISSSPPTVNADAHDHGERRPNRNDATLVHPLIASIASAAGDPCPAGGSNTASSARAHRRKCAPISSARAPNRCRQPRTVSPGHPEPVPRPPVPLPAHRDQRRADHIRHIAPTREAQPR